MSIWTLLKALCVQKLEQTADTKAITVAHVDPKAGISMLKHFYNPEFTDWPGYAKLQAIVMTLVFRLFSLPILKQHFWLTIPSYQDRVANLKNIQVSTPTTTDPILSHQA